VYGGFVDGSGWQKVLPPAAAGRLHCRHRAEPRAFLEGDAAVTRRILQRRDRPTVLVGHSYGGAAISKAGNHRPFLPSYMLRAFARDEGESVGT